MRRRNLFWGAILVLIGGLLLLDTTGVLDSLGLRGVNVWSLIWPLGMILFGLWILLGFIMGPDRMETKYVSVPLEGASQAAIRVRYGAGKLDISGQEVGGELLSGSFSGGVEVSQRRVGDEARVDLRLPVTAFSPFSWPFSGRDGGPRWTFQLHPDIPLTLRCDTGASESYLDLSRLQVTDFRLQTGASETTVIMPENTERTRAQIEGGAASITMRIPDNAAARIRVVGALSSTNIDPLRFQRRGEVYITEGYEGAGQQIDVHIQLGVGSVTVR
jgi:hypothetical protein